MMDIYILAEIFKKLPVRQVFRFRCVCKSWNSLISSSSFITHHHLISTTTSDKAPDGVGKSYFVWNTPDIFKTASSYAFYDPRVSVSDQYPTCRRIYYNDQVGVGIDRRPYHDLPHLVDVVHGVVCLHRDLVGSIVLWNPTINKYVEIPPLPSHKSTLGAIGFGFYIDLKKYEYCFKVVTIPGIGFDHYSSRLEHQPTLEVFSTRKGWRRVVAGHIDLCGAFITREGRFLNGTIYWIVTRYLNENRRTKNFLLMFECEREEFKMTDLPDQFNRTGIKSRVVLTYRGMLSVFVDDLEMWTMEEHGVTRIWKLKLYEIANYVEIKGYVFEESMFFMDAKSESMSFCRKRDEDGVSFMSKMLS